MNKFKLGVLSISTAFLLSGCGGGGSTSSSSDGGTTTTSTTATLIDNILSGVKYVNGTSEGYTDANGNFPYTSGIVEFYIGSIKIGEISSLPTDKKVYIQDVVGVSRNDTTDSRVVMISTLLQSLDSDTTTDEIEINLNSHNQFTEYSNISEFSDFNAVKNYLQNKSISNIRTEDQVIEHLRNTLVSYGELTDTTAPELLSSSIPRSSTNIGVGTSIELTFSEAIPREYLTSDYFTFIDENNNPIDITIRGNLETVTITPTNNLQYSTEYNLRISTNIMDFARNSLVDNRSANVFSFITENLVDTTPPIFTSASTINVDENQTSVLTVHATDNSTVSYSIAIPGTSMISFGADAASFNINPSTGVLTFVSAPDYETKNSYEVTIKGEDVSLNSSYQHILVNINDINENIVQQTGPVFSSSTTFNAAENQTNAFTAVATDTTVITYSLSGTDASSFNIDSSTGVVTFINAPDYETKNSYSIIVTATNAINNTTTQNVTINITDVTEITFNGKSYSEVISPITGRTWLDRNLGATKVCNSFGADIDCQGDKYQWGRLADGHELSTSNETTATAANDPFNVGHSDFIWTGTNGDWLSSSFDLTGSSRSAMLRATDGTGICPSGYLVPTFLEFISEFPNVGDDTQTSFLKLYKNHTTRRTYSTAAGAYWTSNNPGISNSSAYFNPFLKTYDLMSREYATPIRCIKAL